MKNMKVAMKQMVSFGIVIVLSAAIGIVGIVGLTSLSHGIESLYQAASPLAELGTARENFQTARAVVWEGIIWSSLGAPASEMNRIESELDEQFQEFYDNMTVYEGSLASAESIALWTDIMQYFNDVIEPGFHSVLAAAVRGDTTEELMDLIEVYDTACDRVTDELDELFAMRDAHMDSVSAEDQALASSLMVIIIVVIAVALVISIFMGVYVSKIISSPLKVLRGYLDKAGTKGKLEMSEEEKRLIPVYSQYKDEVGQAMNAAQAFFEHVVHISDQLEKISNGDLTVHVEVLSDEDVLGNSLQKMEDNLNNMFGSINSSTIQVSTGAKQVADGAQSLAQGSTEQAASIEELSASISEIAGKTKENAEMAERAASLAGSIMQNAEKGNRQMDDMMKAVNEINEASQSIGKVIKTIDDIAFQTNILALNAAVEAARAGQHGKGFAVVAEEVRNLAAKSADAAKETGVMIQNSMEKAELGSRIAGETAESLTEIVSGITESGALIGDIARSSDEQSAGISQINTGIDQVAQVVQQNSATAQQSAAASQQMSAQSSMLQDLVAQFKLKNAGSGSLPPHKAPQSHHIDEPEITDQLPAGDSGDFGKY